MWTTRAPWVVGVVWLVGCGLDPDDVSPTTLEQGLSDAEPILLEAVALEPPGSRFSYALGINPAGDVVGFSLGLDFRGRGFVYRWEVDPDGATRVEPEQFTLFGVDDANVTTARAVNAGGVIVGYYGPGPSGPFHSFRRTEDAGIEHLCRFAVQAADGMMLPTQAHGINARGDITGLYVDAGRTRGFVLNRDALPPDDCGPQLIGLPPSAVGAFDAPDSVSTTPLGINSAGDIVGHYEGQGSPQIHAFVRHADGTFEAPIDYPGANFTSANGIGPSGLQVGPWGTAGTAELGYVRDGAGHFGCFAVTNSTQTHFAGASPSGDRIVGRFRRGPQIAMLLRFQGGSWTQHLDLWPDPSQCRPISLAWPVDEVGPE